MAEATKLWDQWRDDPNLQKPEGVLALVRIDAFVSLGWFRDGGGLYLVDDYTDTKGRATFIAMYNIHRYKDAPLVPATLEEGEPAEP